MITFLLNILTIVTVTIFTAILITIVVVNASIIIIFSMLQITFSDALQFY